MMNIDINSSGTDLDKFAAQHGIKRVEFLFSFESDEQLRERIRFVLGDKQEDTEVAKICGLCEENEVDCEGDSHCSRCLDLLNHHDEDAILAYKELGGHIDNFEEAYEGKWSSDEQFVEQLITEIGDLPANIPNYIYIDWERTAKDVMMDYEEQDGYYFRKI